MSRSAETRGGTGFTYQNVVVASYLAAALAEAAAPATGGRVVFRVGQQQDAFGEPLDDVVVDCRSSQETEARLSLQVTRSLTVSRAPSNDKFRRVIHACWDTLSKPDFREGVDRFGCVVDDIAKQSARALQTLCEMARGSLDAGHFDSRFDGSERVSKDVRRIKEDIAALLEERLGTVCSPAPLHRFLGHFVLVRFDYLHEGTTQLPACVNLLRTVLADSHTGQASLVWNHLCQLASQTAGTSDQFDRTRLVRSISPEFRLRGARSLAQDLRLLTAVAFESVRAIEDDVGGARLERESLDEALDEALRSARYVQIRGLAGVGKSALLRRWVERALKAGPVLFLKSDRLKGFGWRSFANSIGLSAADLTELLVEVEAVGSNTLFIDGIDRVSKEHQPIVQDIVRTVLESPSLSQWRIVVTLRDAGIEPLRNWLPTSLLSSGVGHVHVGMLDDAECRILAVAMPRLEPLLFGEWRI